ncbi:MAG: anti-sigma factor antagonist [Spirochaetes bacterium]|jgi:anti-anti-sigma factor|nr:anti-sigma factor antagonist [Spirochaetota bacterium]
MNVTIRKNSEEINVIGLEGELDLYTTPTVKETVARLFSEGETKFVVDLDGVSYLDSSGIGILLYIYTSCQKRGLHVFFTNLKGPVAKVISLTKLDGFLPIVASVETAIRRLSAAAQVRDAGDAIKQIRVDSSDPLFDTTGMYNKTFYIDLSQVRRLSNLIAQKAPKHVQEINMLEQQISEIIKNGVRHGNGNDKEKALQIWFSFNDHEARVIVQDEGEGFQDVEKWNEFYRRKIECYRNSDFDEMMNYLAFRTEHSTDADGGNAMFAAIEYWNGGLVLNNERNAIAVRRVFHKA